MHVDEAQQSGALQLTEVGDQLLDSMDCGVQSVVGIVIDSVQVITTDTCSVVA